VLGRRQRQQGQPHARRSRSGSGDRRSGRRRGVRHVAQPRRERHAAGRSQPRSPFTGRAAELHPRLLLHVRTCTDTYGHQRGQAEEHARAGDAKCDRGSHAHLHARARGTNAISARAGPHAGGMNGSTMRKLSRGSSCDARSSRSGFRAQRAVTAGRTGAWARPGASLHLGRRRRSSCPDVEGIRRPATAASVFTLTRSRLVAWFCCWHARRLKSSDGLRPCGTMRDGARQCHARQRRS
jgi:hypothetical protein